jgi:hypothetical protein
MVYRGLVGRRIYGAVASEMGTLLALTLKAEEIGF